MTSNAYFHFATPVVCYLEIMHLLLNIVQQNNILVTCSRQHLIRDLIFSHFLRNKFGMFTTQKYTHKQMRTHAYLEIQSVSFIEEYILE